MTATITYLPTFPLPSSHMLIFGSIVLLGLVGGEIAHRLKFLPRITGYMVIGLIFGPSGLNVLTQAYLDSARVFMDIALGLILFQLGLKLDFADFRKDRSLLATGLLESLLSFAAIYLALVALGIHALYALMAAAIGISSSPTVLLLVIRELGASGPISHRAVSLVALNNILSAFVFLLLLPNLHLAEGASLSEVVLQPVYLLSGSICLAYALTRIVLWLARFLGRSESAQFPLLVGMMVVAIDLARSLNLSMLLVLLLLGVFTRNLDRRDDLVEVKFGRAGDIFFLLLFVMAGAELPLQDIVTAGGAACVFVLARSGAKLLAIALCSRWARIDLKRSGMLGLTMVPMAGLAIGLAQTATHLYPAFGGRLSAIVLAAVAIFETVGPVLTEFALKQTGEVAADQVIDH